MLILLHKEHIRTTCSLKFYNQLTCLVIFLLVFSTPPILIISTDNDALKNMPLHFPLPQEKKIIFFIFKIKKSFCIFFFLSFILSKNFICNNGYSPLGRMLMSCLNDSMRNLCKPVLKPSFPWLLIQSFVVWQLACLLGCLAHCFPHVVYGICLWNSARHPDQFLPAGSSGGILLL